MAGCRKMKLTCVVFCLNYVVILGFNLDTTIPIIKEGPKDSYFGFSVAQHQQLRRINPFRLSDEVIGNYLLVGAPKQNLPSSNENYTGAVYKCNIASTRSDDCQLLLGNEYTPQSKADKGRNNQWLGVTVRSGGKGGEVVACAHRYKVSDNNYGLGNCYQMSQEMNYDQGQGIGNLLSPCKGLSIRKEHEEYAFCQGGTSAYVTKNHRLVMGAPGAINWRGMLAEVDISPDFGIKRWFFSPTTESDPVPPPVPPISYLGMSVIGGKFDNSDVMYYVAGAPRSRDYGQVIFFTETASGSILKYEETQILSGELPFSGFGLDLLAVDINGDGYDDLVVGCPYYYLKEKDNIRLEGAIYVYIGNGTQITQYTKKQVIKGRSMSQDECDRLECLHGRFGFSLGNAGDLNRDNYTDFAVGAPYEGKGAVYIFHGSRDGVKESFSQRIYAEDLLQATGWTAFGYSLSGGMDLDDNSYPDLLVGSYESNKVALLRTRPIIYLHSKVSVTPEKLNMSSDAQKKCQYDGTQWYCVEIKLCLRYTAEPVERFNSTVDIIYTIVAEPDRINPRVEFKYAQGSRSKIEKTFTLLQQELTGLSSDTEDPKHACITQIAYLKDQISDVLSTLEFGISYRLPEQTPPTANPGTLPDINEYPILDAGFSQAETMVITKVDFLKKCGSNNICESNLKMTVQVELDYNNDGILVLELGKSKIFKVKVNIENLGEIAYQSAFYLTKPASLAWKQSEPKNIGCSPVNDTMIECEDIGSKELGKPLKAGAITDFVLFFDINDDIMSLVRSIELSVWVNTTSVEVTPLADHVVIPIVVYVNADVQVSGKSEPDSSIQYSGSLRGESAITNEHMIGQSVNHTFTVFNNGPGVVESSEITISWPYELASKYPHGKHLLYLMQPPQVLDGGDAFCFDQPDIVNVIGIKEDYALNIRPRQYRSDNEDAGYVVVNGNGQQRRKRQAEPTQTRSEKPSEIRENGPKVGEAREKKKVYLLDCEKKTAKCYKIKCRIGVLARYQNVKIRLRSRLWESTLLEDFRNYDEVQIRSMASLYIRPKLNVVQVNTDNDVGYATTIAIPSLQIVAEKPLEWWIIALAVLGGILLLIVLALCLWKLGFFKRKRYDDPTTYNVKVQKKKDIHNPTYDTKVETTPKDYPDENDYFLKH